MKTKTEKEFDKLLDEYFDKFTENYPLGITSLLTTEEHINKIKTAITDGKPVEEEKNIEGIIY